MFLDALIQDLLFSCSPRQEMLVSAVKVDIVILTTLRCGYGHYSQAVALRQFFDSKNINSIVIDNILCKEAHKIPHSMSISVRSHLRECLQSFNPTVVISTTGHDRQDVGSCNYPFRLLQTDMDLHCNVLEQCCSHPQEDFRKKTFANKTILENFSSHWFKIWLTTPPTTLNTLDEKERAEYLQVASLFNLHPGAYIGKAGGSTTAENIAMSTYTFYYKTPNDYDHPNEEANRNYLQQIGMGEPIEMDDSYITTSQPGEQLLLFLQRDLQNIARDKVIDWRERVTNSLIRDFPDTLGRKFVEEAV